MNESIKKAYEAVNSALSSNANLARIIAFLAAIELLYGREQSIAWINAIGLFVSNINIGASP